MQIAAAQIIFYAPVSHSLKDKRQIVRSLVDQVRRRFNASIAEVADQDIHQRIVLGVAVVSGSLSHSRNMLDETIRFVENAAESAGAECIAIDRL